MYLLIRKKQFYLILLLVVSILLFSIIRQGQDATEALSLPTAEKIIFIDPGHGGFDPGRVGLQGAHEKEINLAIAKTLQSYLETSGAKVYMTRVEDNGLYSQTDKNKKRTDMKNRKDLVNGSDADIMVSIHQNYFPQKSCKGGQVFYHTGSDEGERLAKLIQHEFVTFLDPNNKRKAKANDDYYVLRETKIPAVIVECGFLSNPGEEALLNTEEYQQKVAWSIYVGVLKYFNDGVAQ